MTTPGSPTFVSQELASGWLTFASEAGRRRLYPVPNNWEQASDERLELMCRAAVSADDTPADDTPADDTPADDT